MSDFKDILAYLRKRDNLSQRELASKLHVSASAIGMYEAGKRYPSREQEEEIADFFNVNLNTLRGKVDDSDEKYDIENARLMNLIKNDERLRDFTKKYISLPDDKQNIVRTLVDSLASDNH